MFNTICYEKAFQNFVRNKATTEDMNILNSIERDNGDFYPIPDYLNKTENTLKKYNFLRRLGTVIHTSSDGTLVKTANNGTAEIVLPGTSYPVDSEELVENHFESHKIASLTKVNHTFVDDHEFDIEDYLSNAFAKRFARCEENVFLNGSGMDEPLGIFNSDIEESVAQDITYESLLNLYFSLDKEYRENAVFVMNDDTLMKIRTIVDSNGLPIFNSNSNTIFGKEVVVSNYMTNEDKPVLFGDFSYFYIIVRNRMSVKVLTQKYLEQGDYGYAGNERLDGKLTEVNAVKALVIEPEE